jgi:hypothetical protein
VLRVLGTILVFDTEPKVLGFKPGQGDKNPQYTSLRMGSKAGSSYTVRFYGMLKISSKYKDIS